MFQCSSASRKFLNRIWCGAQKAGKVRFSALQRAENSSIPTRIVPAARHKSFQCSSASRKFLNSARPSSAHKRRTFQCSSASRKFLNTTGAPGTTIRPTGFSALQRAENSSIGRSDARNVDRRGFSALQRAENSSISPSSTSASATQRVSVLFSEPKIPQSKPLADRASVNNWFQCSSASRKFLNRLWNSRHRRDPYAFQCSSASRKFLNRTAESGRRCVGAVVSVLFSEPKIPQSTTKGSSQHRRVSFSALQRAENSSIFCDARLM